MSDRILVAYASRHGATAETAEVIAETLRERGFSVLLLPVDQVNSLDGLQAVVVGSGVRFGQWLPQAVRFVERFQEQLRRLPTAFFSIHILNLDDSDLSQRNRLGYLEAVHRMVQPQYEAFFPGKLDPRELTFFERLVTRMVGAQQGDLRQQQKVREWAKTIFLHELALDKVL